VPYTVAIDWAAVAKLATSEEAVRLIEDSGLPDEIVAEMRRLAPRDSGEGADSIDWEVDESGEFLRVSWGKAEFYMYFHEVGTEKEPARPFMRPVVDRYNNS